MGRKAARRKPYPSLTKSGAQIPARAKATSLVDDEIAFGSQHGVAKPMSHAEEHLRRLLRQILSDSQNKVAEPSQEDVADIDNSKFRKSMS